MTRREIRENLYAMLFQINFHDEDELQEQIGMYIEDIEKASEKNRAELKIPAGSSCPQPAALQGERANFSCFLALLYLFPTHIPGREYLIGLT